MAGENVGQTNRAEPNREILEGWKASPAHRENLVARPMNATGIARYWRKRWERETATSR